VLPADARMARTSALLLTTAIRLEESALFFAISATGCWGSSMTTSLNYWLLSNI
jgi:hypothetical protein